MCSVLPVCTSQERLMPRRFHVEFIKPSHDDDDGYVVQPRRSSSPSNSLASVHNPIADCLVAECAENRVLGPVVARSERRRRS
jgi:hypothetical protein